LDAGSISELIISSAHQLITQSELNQPIHHVSPIVALRQHTRCHFSQ
jgi:hypothetical protein